MRVEIEVDDQILQRAQAVAGTISMTLLINRALTALADRGGRPVSRSAALPPWNPDLSALSEEEHMRPMRVTVLGDAPTISKPE